MPQAISATGMRRRLRRPQRRTKPSSTFSLNGGESAGISAVPPKSEFLWRGGSVAVRSVPFAPALGRVHEIADALGGSGLVEEAEDDALGHERREIVLVVAPARDDDREVRELLVHLGDEGLGVVVGERGVDEEHRIARGDHEVRRVRRVVGPPDTVMAGNRVAQEVDEDRVGRQDDDVRAARARARLLKCGMRAGCAGRRRCVPAQPRA